MNLQKQLENYVIDHLKMHDDQLIGVLDDGTIIGPYHKNKREFLEEILYTEAVKLYANDKLEIN